jgi:hypothetical protein
MTAKASSMTAKGYGYHDSVGTASHMHSHDRTLVQSGHTLASAWPLSGRLLIRIGDGHLEVLDDFLAMRAACGTVAEHAAALAGRRRAREVRDVPNAVLKRPWLRQEPNPVGSLPAVKDNTLIIP